MWAMMQKLRMRSGAVDAGSNVSVALGLTACLSCRPFGGLALVYEIGLAPEPSAGHREAAPDPEGPEAAALRSELRIRRGQPTPRTELQPPHPRRWQ